MSQILTQDFSVKSVQKVSPVVSSHLKVDSCTYNEKSVLNFCLFYVVFKLFHFSESPAAKKTAGF